MADGTIKIGVDVDQKGLASKLSSLGKNTAKALGATATALTGLGIAAIKAGIAYESAFAGVLKTVDFDGAAISVEEMSKGLREMAKEIPTSAVELAGIAEAAGQLGIETDNILAFTRVMADLGVATNLTGEAAATTFARFANITGMSQGDFDRLGSTIVALGNNFATTEAEIAEMALRLAAAGTGIGMSEHQILALATTLSSLGIASEAGGSAFSKVMSQIQLAVETNSDKLADFASVAGMTTEQFSEAFEADALGAIMEFVTGLDKADESATKLLDDMDITEVRMTDALKRTAGAGDLVSRAMNTASDAWEDNTALTREAAQRYSTLESKLTMLANSLVDIGIGLKESVDGPLNDVVSTAQDAVNKLATAFDKDGLEGLVSAIGEVIADVIVKISESAPGMVSAGTTLINSLISGLGDNSKLLIASGAQIVTSIIDGISSIGVTIIETLTQLIKTGLEGDTFSEITTSLFSAGTSLVQAVINGIAEILPALTSKIGEIISEGTALEKALGIIALAIGAFKIGTSAINNITKFKDALSGVLAVFSAHPALAVFVAGTAIAAGIAAIVSAVRDANDPIKQYKEEAEGLVESTEALSEDMKRLQEGFEETQNIQTLIDRYHELKAVIDNSSSSTDEVTAATEELASVRQQLIDVSNGVVTAEGELTGAFDAQVAALENMTEVQKSAYDAELLYKFSQAQAELPRLIERQSELLGAQEDHYIAMGDELEMLAGLQMKLTEGMELVDNDELMNTEEGMRRLTEILSEASALTGGEYDFLHLAGLAATVERLKGETSGFEEEIRVFNDSLTANKDAVAAWGEVTGMAFARGIITAEQGAQALGLSVEAFTAQYKKIPEAAQDAVDESDAALSTAGEGADASGITTFAEAYVDGVGNILDANGNLIVSSDELQDAVNGITPDAFLDTAGNIVDADGRIIASSEAVGKALAARAQAEAENAKLTEEQLKDIESAYDSYVDSNTDAFDKIKQNSTTSVKQMIKNLESNQKDVKDWSDGLNKLAESGLDEGFLQQLRDMGPEGKKQVELLVKEMEKGADGKFPELVDTIKKGLELAEEETKAQFTGEEWQNSGEEAIKSIATGIAEATVLDSSVQAAITAAKTTATSAVVGADFASAGKNMVAGVALGVANNHSLLNAAMQRLASAAKAAFNAAIDSASPAKEFIPSGKNIVGGVAKGVEVATPVLNAALETMAAVAQEFLDATQQKTSDARLKLIQDEIATIEATLAEYEKNIKDTRDRENIEELRDAVKKAKTKKKREEAQKALNEALKKLEMERLADQQDFLEAELEAYEKNIDTLVKAYDFLGDRIIEALETRYEGERDAQLARIEEEYNAAVAAADALYEYRKSQSDAYLKQLEAEMTAEVAALRGRIDAINAEIAAEKEAERIANNAAKIAELRAAVDRAKNAKFRAAAEAALQEELERQAEEARQLAREAELAALEQQIDDIKANYDEQVDLEEARMDEMEASYKAQTDLLKQTYDEQEKATEAHYKFLLSADNLAAEARYYLLQESNDEMIALLETYNPNWFDAGKSFGELFVEALDVEMDNVETLIDRVSTFAQNRLDWIKAQVAEMYESVGETLVSGTLGTLDSLIASGGLSDLTATAKTVELSQTLIFNQPIQSPSEVAAAVRSAGQEAAYAIP